MILFGFQWGSIVLYDLELNKVVTKFDVPNELVNFLDNSMYAEHRIAQIVFSQGEDVFLARTGNERIYLFGLEDTKARTQF